MITTNPYCGTDVIPGEKILKLKIIVAIYALIADWLEEIATNK